MLADERVTHYPGTGFFYIAKSVKVRFHIPSMPKVTHFHVSCLLTPDGDCRNVLSTYLLP